MTSRTSVHVGKGLVFFRLYSSMAMRNSNCSSDICPSSADFRSSVSRLPGPRRRSRPKRLSTMLPRRSSFLRRSGECSLFILKVILKKVVVIEVAFFFAFQCEIVEIIVGMLRFDYHMGLIKKLLGHLTG